MNRKEHETKANEAFSGLDPLIRREMQDQLRELQEKLDKTILFITQDPHEAICLGDRIAMMRDGQIEQIGNAEQILHHPASEYVERFGHAARSADLLLHRRHRRVRHP